MTRFVNDAERVFANICDKLNINWEYEQTEFILREEEGVTTKAFVPDFYLPEFNIFVEITMAQQGGRSRKIRKIDQTHAKYPGVHVVLLGPDQMKMLAQQFDFVL